MTPEQTKAFLDAVIESGLNVTRVVPPWMDEPCLQKKRLQYHADDAYRFQTHDWNPLLVGDATDGYWMQNVGVTRMEDPIAAALIATHMQAELDEAHVQISLQRDGTYFVTREVDDAHGAWDLYTLDVDGGWSVWEPVQEFTSRPLAMLAAYQALKESTDG